MQTEKIPATVVTGFLGAGKTTLIRNMLQTANGRKIALIINEFGDLGVDGEVLKGCGIESCSEDDIVELNNGCICCTVADDFVPTITQLMEREEKPDHIVIETSGLALPQPLVNAFNWPEIREQVTVDGVVTVVDSRAVADGRFADDEHKVNEQRQADEALDHESPLEELFEDQITCADLIIMNKSDLVSDPELDAVQHDIKHHISRSVKMIKASNGSLSADILLGLGSASETDMENRKSHHELHHENDVDHDHDHDEFETFVVNGSEITDPEAFTAGIKTIIGEHDILRLKGFLKVGDKPMRMVIQAVGNRIDTHFDRLWNADETRQCHLVVIGLEGLNQGRISDQITKLFE